MTTGEGRRRTRAVRPRSIDVDRVSKKAFLAAQVEYPEATRRQLPILREDCPDDRPCPYVSCRHHLYLEASPRTGSIKLNFPDLEVEDMTETCALDVAERGPLRDGEVAVLLNITANGVRKILGATIAKIVQERGELLREAWEDGPVSPPGHVYPDVDLYWLDGEDEGEVRT